MVFHKSSCKKAFFIVKMTGAGRMMVWPANSDFWKAPLIKPLITYKEPSTRHREQTANGLGTLKKRKNVRFKKKMYKILNQFSLLTSVPYLWSLPDLSEPLCQHMISRRL